MSHDVRNSTRALSEIPHWICEDLAESQIAIPAEIAENLELLRRHSKRLDRMLADLLAYSRVGRMSSPSKVQLADIIDVALQAIELPQRFNLDVQPIQGAVEMPEDEAELLVKSLVDNAVKHGTSSGGQLVISSTRQGDEVRLQFEDNGPGISEKFMERAFLPMKTGKRRDDIEGSGMGLAIVQKIVSSAGGSILAGRSEALGGFRVVLCFPQYKPRPA